jgi:hypothetical protein
MTKPILVWEVTNSDGVWRKFRSFEEAEGFARQRVAASAAERFAIAADISGPGEWASVRLDGCGRVWTDFGVPA